MCLLSLPFSHDTRQLQPWTKWWQFSVLAFSSWGQLRWFPPVINSGGWQNPILTAYLPPSFVLKCLPMFPLSIDPASLWELEHWFSLCSLLLPFSIFQKISHKCPKDLLKQRLLPFMKFHHPLGCLNTNFYQVHLFHHGCHEECSHIWDTLQINENITRLHIIIMCKLK